VKAVKVLVVAMCCLIAGCGVEGTYSFFTPEGLPKNQQIWALYRQTNLKQSTSSEVLARFDNPKYALLSQSKSIVALADKTNAGRKMWFNMVTFDENELIAKRKYFLISNERPKQFSLEPWEGVDFGCQMVLPKDFLDEPYANENARRIAILKKVDSDTRKDTGEIGTDNKAISLCGMMAGQGMESLLTTLNESPSLAARLGEPNGLEFEHVTFDKGKLRMVIDNDIVTVRMRLGSFVKGGILSFEKLGAMEEF
jgi:hypothetical protein